MIDEKDLNQIVESLREKDFIELMKPVYENIKDERDSNLIQIKISKIDFYNKTVFYNKLSMTSDKVIGVGSLPFRDYALHLYKIQRQQKEDKKLEDLHKKLM